VSLTKLLALAVGALALSVAAVEPALARQTPPGEPSASASTPTADAQEAQSESDRVSRMPTPRNRRNRAQPAPPSAEEVKVAAQAQLTAAGVVCEVTEATLLGVSAEQQPLYEAACASGPGYLALASTPPQVFNCLELAGQAETSRLRDPVADVGQQCALPANQNGLAVIGGFARDAGLACTTDQAAAIGKSNAGNLIYEVGCSEGVGYWLEKLQDGWKTTSCWDLALSNTACRYTTPAEALDGARDDEHRHVLRETAENGAGDEERDGGEQERLAAEQVAHLAVDRHRHGRGEEVGRDDPREVLDPVELAHERRQGAREHHLAQAREEHDDHERQEEERDGAAVHRRGGGRALERGRRAHEASPRPRKVASASASAASRSSTMRASWVL